MVGSPVDAARAKALAEVYSDEFLLSDDGSTRLVYLINDVVYKVNRSFINDNAHEYTNGAVLRRAVESLDIFVPDMSLYGDILAMEYVEGEPTGDCMEQYFNRECDSNCLPNDLLDTLASLGWEDSSYGNAIWSEGYLYLIDVSY